MVCWHYLLTIYRHKRINDIRQMIVKLYTPFQKHYIKQPKFSVNMCVVCSATVSKTTMLSKDAL